MANPFPFLKPQFFDANGDPLVGGKLYTYIAGTTTPLTTYTDAAGDTPNTNPIILDSAGRADIWLGDRSYKFSLTDADDAAIWTEDNVNGASASGNSTEAWATHSVTDGQSATALSGETVDFASYKAADWDYVVIRGTTVISSGTVSIQNLNGTGVVNDGATRSSAPHGVTWGVSQASLVCTLTAALDVGAGDGTIRMTRRLVPV